MGRKNEVELALGQRSSEPHVGGLMGAVAPPNGGVGEEGNQQPPRKKRCAPADALVRTVVKKVRSGRAAKGKGDNDKDVFEMNERECAVFLGDFFHPTCRKKLMDKDTSALLDGLSAKLIRGFLRFSEVQDPLMGVNKALDDRNKVIKDVRAKLKSKDKELITTLQKLSVAEEVAKAKDAAIAELKDKITLLEFDVVSVQKHRDVEMDKFKLRCETARQEKETALKEQQIRFEAENTRFEAENTRFEGESKGPSFFF